MKTTKLFLIPFLLLLGACDADVTGARAEVSSLDAASTTSAVWLSVRPDLRRCVAPLCGGVFVKRAGYATTRCADGSYQVECYVAGFSFAGLRLDADERAYISGRLHDGLALVRGTVAAKSYGDFGNLGVLKVSEVWDAATDQAATGPLSAVASTGIVCLAAPCPTLHATQLNRSANDTQITELDLAALQAGDDAKAEAMNLAYTGRLLVAGEIESCTGGNVILHASQVFEKLEHALDVTGTWQFASREAGRFTYSFAADGTFVATHEPGCVLARPACMVKVAPQEGTFTVAGARVHLEYSSELRRGESADLELDRARLVGSDFGASISLARQ